MRKRIGMNVLRMQRAESGRRFWRTSVSLLLVLISIVSVSAQDDAYFYHLNPYNFVRYDLNQMHFPGNRQNIDRFHQKLEHLLTTGEGRINIVHVGGSHIQAGTFSGQMRTRFQQMNGNMNAGWGFMFPYRIARTNSPFGYYIRYSGNWRSFRNIESKKSGTLGVGGISATTSSPKARLTILLEDENSIDYSFNKFRVYFQNKQNNYTLSVDSAWVKSTQKTDDYIDFELNRKVDSLHSIGVNGAHVPAFLRCQLFEKQLAELQPDMVILGIGINDAYGRKFSQSRFESHYAQLIAEIQQAAPNAAIVFTTNNDSYLYRRYVNKNGEKVRESMFRMAEKYNAGVWDMFEVMGGLNSVVVWQRNHLAQSDKIHFTREGYLTIADLFFTALMQDFEQYIQNENKIVLTGTLKADATADDVSAHRKLESQQN